MPQPQIADIAWLTGFTGTKTGGNESGGIRAELPMEIGGWTSTGYEGAQGPTNRNEQIALVTDMFNLALVTALARGEGELHDGATAITGDYTIEFSLRIAPGGLTGTALTFGDRVRISFDDEDSVGPDSDAFHYWMNNVLVSTTFENGRSDFAYVYHGSNRLIFVNGVLRNTKDMGSPAAGVEDPMVWGDADSENTDVFSFDEVRITKGALWLSDYIVRLPHPRTDPPAPPSLEPETTDLSFPFDILDANVAGHTREPQDVFIRTDVETGTPRTRRQTTTAFHLQTISWTMSNAMLLSFHLWFEGVLKAGQESFYLKVADPSFASGVAWYRARFAEPYNSVFRVNDDWTVSAQLILYGDALEDRPPLSSFEGTSLIRLFGDGLVNSPAALVSTSTIALNGTGDLNKAVALESTSTIALIGTGNIHQVRALEGSSTIALVGTGDLDDGGAYGLGFRLGESLGGVAP